jgi:hypothetical protein
MVKRVLVIVSSKSTAEPPNWYNIFSGCHLASGEAVEVDQAECVCCVFQVCATGMISPAS